MATGVGKLLDLHVQVFGMDHKIVWPTWCRPAQATFNDMLENEHITNHLLRIQHHGDERPRWFSCLFEL